jgi:hypothetical protein
MARNTNHEDKLREANKAALDNARRATILGSAVDTELSFEELLNGVANEGNLKRDIRERTRALKSLTYTDATGEKFDLTEALFARVV